MFKKITIASTLCAMAACTQYAEVTTPPQPVAFSNAGVQQASIGVANATMRTFTEGEKQGRIGEEILGASCNLRGSGFGADFQTPAILQLPKFRGAADPISVNCTANGQSGDLTRNATNLTLQRINQSSGQTSLLGVLVEAAVQGVATAARNPLKDEFGYSTNVNVIIPGAVQ